MVKLMVGFIVVSFDYDLLIESKVNVVINTLVTTIKRRRTPNIDLVALPLTYVVP